jgi:Gpi18-like mannosyltransferase
MLSRNRLRISYAFVAGLIKPPVFIIGFLTAIDILLITIFWRDMNTDLMNFLIPWYEFLFEHGRFSALAISFSDYTPPYLYLLSIGTLAHGVFDPATVIRAISVTFNAGAAMLVYLLAVSTGWPRSKAIQIAFIFFIFPETVINSLVWGQCDITYTLFLLSFVYFLLRERGWWATTMLGIAFAFKMQTVFIVPFVLYLLLVRLLLWRQLVMVPLMYLLLLVPAALAGRSWDELLTIYVSQTGNFHSLSLSAPNPYYVFQRIFPNLYELGLYIGLFLAVIVGLILVTLFVRRGGGRSPRSLLLMATLSLTIMPYVLPKMHERYFFPASAMAFLLAIVRLSTWPIMVLIQAANLCSYTIFLLGYPDLWLRASAIFMTCALGLLIWLFFKEGHASANFDKMSRSWSAPGRGVGGA